MAITLFRTFAARAGLALTLVGAGACGVSTQQEIELGAEQSQQINSQIPLVTDPVIVGYVNQLGRQLAATTSRADLDWHFFVVNTDVVNAFALPGGYVYVNRGILERAARMDELAGVIGHEISHVVLRHSVKQMEQVQNANIGVALACTLTNVCANQAAQAAINVGGSLVFAKFSRTDEKEADDAGFSTVVKSGINPQGMLSFFQKLMQEEQSQGGSGATSWFSDHPGTQDRIADIQRLLGAMTPAQLNALASDTPTFQQMKQRVRALPPAPKAAASSGE